MQEMKLHFQRFEFKYLISFQEFHEIRRRLRRYVELDGFAREAAGGFYEVVSLYYDSPKFYYYYEKMDGAMERKKIRLRTYRVDGAWMDYAFFEIKRKHDAVILKDRFLLDYGDCAGFLKNGGFAGTDFALRQSTGDIVREYDQERYWRNLRPQILVSYRREPYVGKFNNNFRVTFDSNINAGENHELFSGTAGNRVLSGRVVMEIKFNGRLPHYIKEIIDGYNLERMPYSKYCYGVDACLACCLSPELNFSRHYFFEVGEHLLINN